jgi:predicted RNA-binding Zn-ribbon protein involved in translation (DUF1610 family)
MKFSKPTGGDYWRSILYILTFLVVITVSAIWLMPDFWYVWLLIVAIGTGALVAWHRGATVYRCPNCDYVYEISFWKDLFAPHGVDKDGAWLLLRCPNCGERKKTRVLKRVE